VKRYSEYTIDVSGCQEKTGQVSSRRSVGPLLSGLSQPIGLLPQIGVHYAVAREASIGGGEDVRPSTVARRREATRGRTKPALRRTHRAAPGSLAPPAPCRPGHALVAALLALCACSRLPSAEAAPTPTPAPPPSCGEGWELAWHDEFDGTGTLNANGLDVERWTIETGLCVNDEQQVYVTDTANVRVEEGRLILEAHDLDPARGDCPGCRPSASSGGPRFTSGRVNSQGKAEFQYGRIEARIKLPLGAGLWPAFWMLGGDIDAVGWPQSGELDVMENLGYENWVSGAVHGPGYSGAESRGFTYTLPAGQAVDAWHTYRVDWTPDQIEWYVDGIRVHTLLRLTLGLYDQPWVFDHPYFIVLNLALGGNYPYSVNRTAPGAPEGGCFGLPPSTIETLPQRVEVDWVRVCTRAD
jgi:beta-glucanase (GH16 family)